MHLDNNTCSLFHSHSTVDITNDTTTQALASDEMTSADEEGDSVSAKTFFIDEYK